MLDWLARFLENGAGLALTQVQASPPSEEPFPAPAGKTSSTQTVSDPGDWTVNVKTAVPVPLPLVARKVMMDVPVAVGVPEILPVAVLTDNPAGNPVASKLVGL